ncbi:putative beta-D-xylosidase 1 [Apostichopus japonicus]|uniref:Putative beta-D-xylosidase 1 n=1 Tax=Stichopus japonicus TaxID=307972 RepID=A0A2G8LPK0_STIJA|nr:putative beta-D-xylosidase 1 [Apostichopus japonicus]
MADPSRRFGTFLVITVISICCLVDGSSAWKSATKDSQSGGMLKDFPFRNTSLPWEKRVDDLIGRLSLDEMILQLARGGARSNGPAPPVPELGIGPHQWNNECLRGAVAAGNATSFPEALGLSAAFSTDLIFKVANATAYEVRAKFNNNSKNNRYSDHTGISCFSPVINIMRHPLWGRNQETYGEDPYLTGELVKSFVIALQGNHPRYIIANAGCKHFAAYCGPDDTRFQFDAKVTDVDLFQTYLPAFKECVKAGSYSVMCSYNSVNGIPACANKRLLTDILRDDWGFKGYVVSDELAMEIMPVSHNFTKNYTETAAKSLTAGCNLDLARNNVATVYNYLNDAVTSKMITVDLIKKRLHPLFYTRFRLGEFDPPEMNPFTMLEVDRVVECPEHQELAVQAAIKTFVLLKNEENTLPVDFKSVNTLAVVGPFANNSDELSGDYAPDTVPRFFKNPFQGLKDSVKNVTLGQGCDTPICDKYQQSQIAMAVTGADFVVVCLGTGVGVETEGQDRKKISLPGKQLQLLKDAVMFASGKPVILLLFNAGPLDISWALSNSGVNAIVECFYPSQATGESVRRMLINAPGANPGGRLPATWPASLDQVPAIDDYDMSHGSTYRYFKGEPLIPFGYGMSYTTFSYSNLKIDSSSIKTCQNETLHVTVSNTGALDGDEVTQVYIKWVNASVPTPNLQLVGFSRTEIKAKGMVSLTFTIEARMMAVYKDQLVIEPGTIEVYVGGQQPNQKMSLSSNVLQGSFKITGSTVPLSKCQ